MGKIPLIPSFRKSLFTSDQVPDGSNPSGELRHIYSEYSPFLKPGGGGQIFTGLSTARPLADAE